MLLAKLWKSQDKRSVGDTAYVGSQGLSKNETGEVTWAGTIVRAQLSPDSMVDTLAAGSEVIVVDDLGSKFIVAPLA